MSQKYILKNTLGAGNNFRINYQDELTDEQYPVVASPGGPMLVIAGAGSGKTRTVTYRVAYLVESGVPLDRILLVTFTNKAAKEMVSRVEMLLKKDVKGIWGGTYHHVGNILLRKHAKLVGYDQNFTIIDRADSKELLDSCVVEANIDTKERRFPKGDHILDVISMSHNTERNIVDVIAYDYAQHEPLTAEIEFVAKKYKEKKQTQNLMDFDDLLHNWLKLLEENPDITERYGNKFLHIMVDEYQDTNSLQAKIINKLAATHRNLMVVGDDSQSIYSFRGAKFKNIIDFPKVYPDAKTFKIETNHRSTPEILGIANTTIILAKERFEKNLKSKRESGQKPAVVPLINVHAQAAFVAQRMLELREEGMSLNEMAVLYRSHYQSMEVQMELTKRGIPFEIRSGIKFFEEAHIKDILAYLKVFHNKRDEIAWGRILKIIPKVGPKTAEKIIRQIKAAEDPIKEITSDKIVDKVPSGGERSFKRLQALLLGMLEKINSPSEMIKLACQSEYADYLKAQYPNFKERLEDLEQLGSYSTQYKDLEELLSSLALVSGLEAERVEGENGKEKEACVLTTIHQAKGLEWKAVFVVWLAEGKFPSYLSFKKEEELEEERRLFYVAVTRAKDELYLTYPIVYSSYEGEILMTPSRYLEELPSFLFEKWDVKESFDPADNSGPVYEEEAPTDISQFREVKLSGRDSFEAIDIKDLFK
ncbi:MAG: ATP-dependent helicase [Candidatus Margulisiibacteriota bacterium]